MKTLTCMVIALLGAVGGRTQISITSPTFTYLETFTQPEVPVGWSFFENQWVKKRVDPTIMKCHSSSR